jgi:hypothetical protein
MTMASERDPVESPQATRIRALLERLLTRFGGAVEFWTVTCLSQRELGDPRPFLADQWEHLWQTVQELRADISQLETSHPSLNEQIAGFGQSCVDLREVFDTLADFTSLPVTELEGALLRLNRLHTEWKLRIALVGTLVPLKTPLPRWTSEQESFYQHSLDSLFDRFYAARQTSPSIIHRPPG